MEGDTVSLRSAAPRWSLEGDSQLLSVLQSLHQTIITKCQETNTQLDAMVSALDNASIDLQNVNNKFMALSNSQFVESRVYEDEVELSHDTKQESPKPEPQSSLSSLKLGLQVLESLHEVVSIVDSDSDEEQSPRRVLRPRFRGRLPPVVGSQAWRDAPHAGLSSDSDSDDSTDKGASALEEYSDSDTDHTASSSSLPSMTSHAPPVTSHAPPVTSHAPPVTSHAPSGHDARTEEQSPEPELDESPQPRKLYTVEKPIPAQIFPDEPPPLDRFEADSDDDIFAELHKQPYPHSNKSHNAADDLFGNVPYVRRNRDDNDIGNIVTNTVARENSPLFSRTEEPDSNPETYAESGVKKPVGGISLFGSKGSESIGAAILKRNQRQSSSESDGTSTRTKKSNIIEDLFTKPTKNIKKEPSNAENEPVTKEAVKDKILFSDNIFDDIDDIFTSSVITETKTKYNKDKESLFDDDLFEVDKSDNNDLFNDKVKDKDNDKSNPLYKSSKDTIEKVKSIFDSDSEDDLFSDVKLKANNLKTNTNEKTLCNDNVNTQTHIHRKKSSELQESRTEIKVVQLKHKLSPNIFDDDNEDDLFGDKTPSEDIGHSKTGIDLNISDGIQNGEDEQHYIQSEVARHIAVNITEAETKVLRLENAGIEEKYISDIKNVSIPDSDPNNVTSTNESESDREDIKKLSVVVQENDIEIATAVSIPKVPSLPKIDFLEEAKLSKEDIAREVTGQIHSKDMFVDIFDDLPPAFEKPMEPKRSKNVNALFDDDSDDEALFFKKDDVITDEKPDLEIKSDRFQIFHDEPPDIDIDFSQKSRNTNQMPHNFDLPDQEHIVNVTKMIGNSTKGEHSITKTERPIGRETLTEDVGSENKHNLDNVNSKITKNEQKSKTDILKLLESERGEDIFKANKDIDEDIFSDPDKNDSNEETSKSDVRDYTNKDDTESLEGEKKSVGRLRPVTININVSSLLPGAVLKKSKSNEETDGQIASRSNEEYSPDVTEPKMVKTVSFKGNLDSEVLDNKLSKERAKIQVKRRPSTRRARLEAVRKSGLDFGSDSTDNSSSFDEPVKEKRKNDKISVPYKKLKDENKLDSELNEANNEIKEVTSKVVYILNDEDIFEVPPRTGAVETNIADNLFNTKDNLPHHTTIKDNKQSLVNTISEKQVIKIDKTKKSLFDDMSDDDTELFKKPVQKSVFDSDSESELFSGKKGKGKIESGPKVEQKKLKESQVDQKVKERKVAQKVTRALFCDDSDEDEDLFGGKTNKNDFKETSKPKPSAATTSQSFEDPLCASRRHDT